MSLQLDFDAKVGQDISFLTAGITGTPYSLRSVCYKRDTTTNINIIVKAIYKGGEYIIDKVSGLAEEHYIFPNARVPYPIDLDGNCKIQFVTEGVSSGTHSVMVNWKSI